MNSIMPQRVQLDKKERVINYVPSFFEKLGDVLRSVDDGTKANYLIWRAVFDYAPYINKAFRDREFEFDKIVNGRQQQFPRNYQCALIVDQQYPQALGALYARKNLKEETKKNVHEMVKNIVEAYREMLTSVDWMDEKTKGKAIEKINAMKSVVAYADELLDDKKIEDYYNRFMQVEINESNFLESILKLSKASANYMLNMLRKSYVKNEWVNLDSPTLVNPLYFGTENLIYLPGALLQDTFYDVIRPNYVNYGAIGYLIGHEITHG
jgi:neprilysin